MCFKIILRHMVEHNYEFGLGLDELIVSILTQHVAGLFHLFLTLNSRLLKPFK